MVEFTVLLIRGSLERQLLFLGFKVLEQGQQTRLSSMEKDQALGSGGQGVFHGCTDRQNQSFDQQRIL